MEAPQVKFEFVSNSQSGGFNIVFYANYTGCSLKFRLSYSNQTARKNAKYKSYAPGEVYFEGMDQRPNRGGSYYLYHVTDLCLFVERKKAWILDKLLREYLNQY